MLVFCFSVKKQKSSPIPKNVRDGKLRGTTQIANAKTPTTLKAHKEGQDLDSSPNTPEVESIHHPFARTNRKLSSGLPDAYSSIIARDYYIPKSEKMQ